MKHLRQIAALLLIISMLAGCASEDDPYKGMSEGQIYQSAQSSMKKGNYDDAVSAYEELSAKYPFGQYATDEQLNIIYAYYKNEDYLSAQAAADRYIHLNPQSRYVDYAYYMKAMSNFAKERSFMENYFPVDPAERDLSAVQQAFNDFNYVLQTYPGSPYVQDSRLHMVYIRNMVARNNLATAKYYMTRAAYAAALNRAREVVFHYQGAPSTRPALKIMYQCYQKLHLVQQAKDILQVIKLNYPDIYNELINGG